MTDTPDYTAAIAVAAGAVYAVAAGAAAARTAAAAVADAAAIDAARAAAADAAAGAARAAYADAAARADQAIVAEAIATHGADAARVYREAEARHTEEAQWCDRFIDERRKLDLAGSYGRIAALIEAATGKE